MRRNFMKGAMLGAMALAGLGGSQSTLAATAKANTDNTAIIANSKATTVKKEKKGAIKVNPLTGGLDMTPPIPGKFGLTPKEYGMRYGNGNSRKGKTNYTRMSHNAKVGRR